MRPAGRAAPAPITARSRRGPTPPRALTARPSRFRRSGAHAAKAAPAASSTAHTTDRRALRPARDGRPKHQRRAEHRREMQQHQGLRRYAPGHCTRRPSAATRPSSAAWPARPAASAIAAGRATRRPARRAANNRTGRHGSPARGDPRRSRRCSSTQQGARSRPTNSARRVASAGRSPRSPNARPAHRAPRLAAATGGAGAAAAPSAGCAPRRKPAPSAPPSRQPRAAAAATPPPWADQTNPTPVIAAPAPRASARVQRRMPPRVATVAAAPSASSQRATSAKP